MLYIYLQIGACTVVDCVGMWTQTHTHTRGKRRCLLNTLQGSTWDKIQQHWIIPSIYQGENTNPDKRTRTYIYSTLRGLPGYEGALVSVVIYQDMWFKVPWQAKPTGLYLCKFLLIALNPMGVCPPPRNVLHPLTCVWICIIHPLWALWQDKYHQSRKKDAINKWVRLQPNMQWSISSLTSYNSKMLIVW